MIVRSATAADRDAVLTLAQHHAASVAGGPLVVDLARVPALWDSVRASGAVIVGELEHEDSGTLAGMCALFLHEHFLTGDRYAEVLTLWVEPQYRNGLLAGWLLARAETWAASEGCTFLKAGAPVATAVGDYLTRSGYVPIETAYLKRVA